MGVINLFYRKFGKTDWDISVIGQGCWNIGNQWGEMDDRTAERIIKTAFDNGMNLFDVAESYGDPNGLSEMRLGRALRGIRDQVYIVDKIAWWGTRPPDDWPPQKIPKKSPEAVRHCAHACAGRLRTDYIDVMLCHDGNVKEPSLYIEAFEQLQKEGFIREYGISTDSLEHLKNFYEESNGNMAVVEVDYSLINKVPEKEFLPFCQEKNLGVLIRGPLAQGLLTGKYDRETVFTDSVREKWNKCESNRKEFEEKIKKAEKIKDLSLDNDLVTTALRYVISHSVKPVAIPGATSTYQARNNAQAGKEILSSQELEKLKEI